MRTLPIAFALALLGAPVHAQVLGGPVTLGPVAVGPGVGPVTLGSGVGPVTVGPGVGPVNLTPAGPGTQILNGGSLNLSPGVGGLGGGGLSLGGLGAGIGSSGATGGLFNGGAPGTAAAAPGGGISVTGAGTAGAALPGLGGGLGFTLPPSLRPDDRRRASRKRVIRALLTELGEVPTTPEDVALDRIPLRAIAGTPYETVAACRGAILAAAQQYNPVFATTASGGPPRNLRGGALAPIQTKLIYLRQDGYEVKQARVNCRLTSAGTVNGLS